MDVRITLGELLTVHIATTRVCAVEALSFESHANVSEYFSQGAATLWTFSKGSVREALVNVKAVSAVFASV